MSIKNLVTINGDILNLDCLAFVHQANCFSRMKSGIAKSITDLYPVVKFEDDHCGYNQGNRFGKFSAAKVVNVNTGNPLYIGNLYGQYDYGRNFNRVYTDYKKLLMAFRLFMEYLEKDIDLHEGTIAIPYGMGCGLANGDWKIVTEIIEYIATMNPTFNFTIVKYDAPPFDYSTIVTL